MRVAGNSIADGVETGAHAASSTYEVEKVPYLLGSVERSMSAGK